MGIIKIVLPSNPFLLFKYHSQITTTLPDQINPLKTGLFINHGTIYINNYFPFILHWILETATLIYAIMVYLPLYDIFLALSLKQPFTLANVKGLRIVAISILIYQILLEIHNFISNWFVHTNFTFTSEPNNYMLAGKYMFSFPIDLNILILCLAIFLIAEIIRCGVEIKAEQDLTV